MTAPRASSILEPVERSRVPLPIVHDVHAERCPVCGLSGTLATREQTRELVARSPAMQACLRRAARFVDSAAPLVLQGESGTGKEIVARVLHGSSRRGARPFVAVNVAALPPDLLESELFGHARGAFTGATDAKEGLFQAAEGGTLFLDEIAEMAPAIQAKLLRALQDGEVRRLGETRPVTVHVRVICASHQDLADRVRRGLFREDLFYRLRVLSLRVPPLRERREDILPLAEQIIAEAGSPAPRLSSGAQSILLAYAWPGNVRELSGAIQHGLALCEGGVIRPEDLPEDLIGGLPAARAALAGAPVLRSLAEVEREHILKVLSACDGSPASAARVLGIGRNTLWRKLRSYE